MQNIVNAINRLVEAIKAVVVIHSVASAFYYISSSAGTTITVANTYYKIAGTYASINEDKFEITAGGTIKYIGDKPALVRLAVAVSMSSDTNNVIAKYCPAINSSTDSRLALTRKIATLGDVGSLTGAGTFTLEKDDEVEVHVTCDVAGAVLTAEQMLISFH